MRIFLMWIGCGLLLWGCKETDKREPVSSTKEVYTKVLSMEDAKKIVALPVSCMMQEYPNRLGQTLASDADLKSPKALRPIFYGCFDWHSAVHGFWSIVKILKMYPELDTDNRIRQQLDALITEEHVAIERSFFEGDNKNFERTYGWAWFFQLHGELLTWDDDDAQRWAITLQPLANLFIERYETYLSKLYYPIRTGTHDNSAFSLSLFLDYARLIENKAMEELIVQDVKRLFLQDVACNLSYEPSGHDFLSPCLEEARLMSKVMEGEAYRMWLSNFLPSLFVSNFSLEVALVSDRTDGHLVHLDGLNFSRATCLKEIAKKVPELEVLQKVAEEHFEAAFKNITNDDYMGSHWLGSFALYSLTNG